MEPNYSEYSQKELKEALRSIDRTKFPDRVSHIATLLERFENMVEEEPIKHHNKSDEKQSLIFGRIGYPVFSLLLFYISLNSILTGKAVVYRSDPIFLNEDPFFFFLQVTITTILGFVCSYASIAVWFKK